MSATEILEIVRNTCIFEIKTHGPLMDKITTKFNKCNLIFALTPLKWSGYVFSRQTAMCMLLFLINIIHLDKIKQIVMIMPSYIELFFSDFRIFSNMYITLDISQKLQNKCLLKLLKTYLHCNLNSTLDVLKGVDY